MSQFIPLTIFAFNASLAVVMLNLENIQEPPALVAGISLTIVFFIIAEVVRKAMNEIDELTAIFERKKDGETSLEYMQKPSSDWTDQDWHEAYQDI